MATKKNSNRKVSAEKQIYDLKQLLEISKSLNSTLDLPMLIETFLYVCMAQFQVTGAALFTKPNFDATSFQLGDNFYSIDTNKDIDYSIPEGHPLISSLARSSDCLTMEMILESGISIDKTIAAIESLDPSLIVPLKIKGVVNGILVLGEQIEKAEYSDYEIEQAVTMASLAAITINNALLLDMSTTDIMTHLKLKHFFYTTLSEKIEEAFSTGVNISVIMFDIDYFKRFNDNYGHECGDFVLQKTAEVIQSNTRATDLAARYGGEEFVVMLCNTTLEEAEKIAERIRRSIERMDIVYEQQHLTIAISAGVAQYSPIVDNSPRDLVERADMALYISKNNGRNRVTIAPTPDPPSPLALLENHP